MDWAEENNFTFYDLQIPAYKDEEEEEIDEEDERGQRWRYYYQHRALLDDYLRLENSRKYRESMLQSLSFPAQKLVRMGYRKRKRNWRKRWMAAYDSLPPQEQAKACRGKMIALLDCDIWRAISVFNLPYPPFDYDSGMDVEAVDYDAAAKIGLVPPLD